MSGIVSRVRVDLVGAPPRALLERDIHLPGAAQPIRIGTHPAWDAKYGVAPGQYESRPTANDMFVGALGACMVATYAAALEARVGFLVTGEHCSGEAIADIGPSDTREWIVRSVLVRIRLDIPSEHHATAERVRGFFHSGCPLSQTLAGGRCEIRSELVLVGQP